MDFAIIISYSSLSFLVISTLVMVFIWKDYYFIYNHRILFVIGLLFSRYLTNYAIISALTWYFTYYGDDLVKSAILTNIRGLLSSFFVIFMAHAADSHIGRFQTLLYSNIAYIGALVIFRNFHPYNVNWLLVLTLVLLALGTSGDKLLQDVLHDLVNDIDNSPDRNKERSIARATVWSRIAYVFAATSAILWVAPGATGGVHPSWTSSFITCIITLTLALVISFFGHNAYHQGELTERPVEVFFGVFQARIISGSIKNINSRQGRSQKNLDIEKGDNGGITQQISTLHLDTKGKEDSRNISCYKQDVLVVKSLLRMFPMWGVFLVVSLISATGSAFFLQQYNNLHTDNDIAVQIYSLVQDFSSFAIPFLYRWICCSRQNEKVKICVGMLCGILSCVFAWQLEVHRLKEVSHLVNQEEDIKTSISFLWLVPQFCVLGCMEGLTGQGLLKFYKSQLKEEQLQGYGEEYIEVVMGLGKLVNIFLILILQRWFGDTINDSRLDKYYLVLVGVGSVNFIAYCCIARCFYKDQELANPDQKQDNQDKTTNDSQEDLIEQFIDMEQNQDPGDSDT